MNSAGRSRRFRKCAALASVVPSNARLKLLSPIVLALGGVKLDSPRTFVLGNVRAQEEGDSEHSGNSGENLD